MSLFVFHTTTITSITSSLETLLYWRRWHGSETYYMTSMIFESWDCHATSFTCTPAINSWSWVPASASPHKSEAMRETRLIKLRDAPQFNRALLQQLTQSLPHIYTQKRPIYFSTMTYHMFDTQHIDIACQLFPLGLYKRLWDDRARMMWWQVPRTCDITAAASARNSLKAVTFSSWWGLPFFQYSAINKALVNAAI